MHQPHLRYPHIDALRGVAALLVLWAHCAEAFMYIALDKPNHGQWMHQVAHDWNFGRLGVALFFVVSGFVIVPSLQGQRGPALVRFARSRFFRLYPAFWVSIVPGSVVFWWLWSKPFGVHDLVLNFTMLPGTLGAQAALGVYWTLEVELLFYGVCALLFCLKLLRQPLVLMALSLLAALGGAMYQQHHGDSESWLGIHLSIMLFGGAARLWLESPARSPLVAGTLILYLLGWFAAAVQGWQAASAGLLPAQVSTYLCAYLMALGLFVLGTTCLRIVWWPMVRIGRISYSLYLLHPIALYTVLWTVAHAPEEWDWQRFHIGFYSAIVTALSLWAAFRCFQWVEQPAMQWGRQRADTRFRSAQDEQATSETKTADPA